jgi:hypothetical protein
MAHFFMDYLHMAAILREAACNSILKTMKLQGLCCIPGYCLSRGQRTTGLKEKTFSFFSGNAWIQRKNWKSFSIAWP